MISSSGATVRMIYDALGRVTAFMLAEDTPNNPTRAMTYDDVTIPNAVHLSYRIDEHRRSHTVTYYDGMTKEIQKRVERESGEVVVSGWLIKNPWQQTICEFEPTLDSTLSFSKPNITGEPSRKMFFDGMGRPLDVRNYNGGVSSAEFTPFEITTFDANDNTPAHPNYNTPRREQVDVWNHRTSVIESNSDGILTTTNFAVGLFGELLELFDDSGSICTYTYDLRGNRLKVNHRDAGQREQWFDSHNDIIRTSDAKDNIVIPLRDSEGRITRVEHNGTVVETFVYDDTLDEADGRLVEANYINGKQQFHYNLRGFLEHHTITVDNEEFTLAYEANDMGHQTAIIYPDGTRQTREYTRNGLVESIDGIVDAIKYNARNLPIRIEFSNGITTTIEYEPGIGHVRHQHTLAPNGTVLENVTFSYDELMQITGRTNTAPGAQHEATYEYDVLNQLKHVLGSNEVNDDYRLDYTYHNGYNLAQMAENNWQLGYNDALRTDRLTDIMQPEKPILNINYDDNGNLTNLPGRTLLFNFKNQLEQVTLEDGTVIRYDYDYRGNRTCRKVTRQGNTTRTVFIGRLVEFRAGQFTNFVILEKQRIAVLNEGRTRWVHKDQQGSVNFFSDEQGSKIVKTAYHPYGNERSSSGSIMLRVFAMHDYDDEIGLIYMGHRWYAPEIGRFITPPRRIYCRPFS